MSAEAERAALCGILASPQILEDMEGVLRDGTCFQDPKHRMIYDAILAVSREGAVPDAITVGNHLREQGQLHDGAVSPMYLTQTLTMEVAQANALAYAEIVAEEYRRFVLERELFGISRDLKEGTIKAEEAIEAASVALVSVEAGPSRGATVTAGESAAEVLDAIEKQERDGIQEGGFLGVTTGFSKLDEYTGGYRGGALFLVGAYTSQGKTAWALSSAMAVAEAGECVAVMSMEMPSAEIGLRQLSMTAQVDSRRMQNARPEGKLLDDEWDRLAKAQKKLDEYGKNVLIDDSSDVTLAQIISFVEKINTRPGGKPLRVLFIDYLQLMEVGDDLNQGYAKVTKGLKGLAKKWTRAGKPLTIVLLSQLTKPPPQEIKDGVYPRPTIRDVRQSGMVTNDSDVVAFIYREAPFLLAMGRPPGRKLREAEIIVAKQRSGPVGPIPLWFLAEHTLFQDPPPDAWPA